MARRPSDPENCEPEAAEEAEAAVTLGGSVPTPATTGAILVGAGVADDAEAELAAAEEAGVEVTSVGFTDGEGVAGEILADWNGCGESEGGRSACRPEPEAVPLAGGGGLIPPKGCASAGSMVLRRGSLTGRAAGTLLKRSAFAI